MTYRMFTGPDGETHFEDIEAQAVDVSKASFGKSAGGAFGDWHNERRRQFVVLLSGIADITVSDGETRRMQPGTVMLAEDLTGKGHQTRVIGNEDANWLFVVLAE